MNKSIKKKSTKKLATIEDVANVTEQVYEEILGTQAMIQNVETNLSSKIQESEGSLGRAQQLCRWSRLSFSGS